MLNLRRHWVPAATALLLACGGSAVEEAGRTTNSADYGDADATSDQAQASFWSNLTLHCGQAYRGVATRRPPGDQLFAGDEPLVVHFRECGENELRLPFHVGENRSRTWVLRRTAHALELRHDHRNPDGSEEENSWYGALTQSTGGPMRQEFLRERDGVTSGWAIEVEPGIRYTYGTVRDGEWRYRLDFDLTTPIPEPPAPWGSE